LKTSFENEINNLKKEHEEILKQNKIESEKEISKAKSDQNNERNSLLKRIEDLETELKITIEKQELEN
jgi:hypothetical protein